ncbi:hypothetical protein PMAYCL1PPCAC_24993, partial [Pristionchus mayeri]
NGFVDRRSNLTNLSETRFLPHEHFLLPWWRKFMKNKENPSVVFDPATGEMRFNLLIATKSMVKIAKSEDPETMEGLYELHNHLGKGPTYCLICGMKTGNRDGFYAHSLSYLHIKQAYLVHHSVQPDDTSELHIAIVTLVNVLKKD